METREAGHTVMEEKRTLEEVHRTPPERRTPEDWTLYLAGRVATVCEEENVGLPTEPDFLDEERAYFVLTDTRDPLGRRFLVAVMPVDS